MQPAPSLDSRRRARRQAIPTGVRRACVTLLIGLLMVSLCASVKTSQIKGNPVAHDNVAPEPFAQMALDAIFGDLRQEIVDGSTAVNVPTSSGSTIFYLPITSVPFVPYRVGTNDALANLVKRSGFGLPFYAGPNYNNATGSNRASGESSASALLNGRAVSVARWNRSLLLPKQNPNSDTNLTPLSSFDAPSWVFTATDGSDPTAWDSTLTASGSNPVIGRYAYAIYDEGGLLDLTTAGYPSGTSALQAAYKSSPAFADLKQIGLTQVQIDALVAWRATHPAAGRQDFIDFLTKTVATDAATRAGLQNSLQYLGSFSRDINQPSYISPAALAQIPGITPAIVPPTVRDRSAGGNDAGGTDISLINPSFLSVRVKTASTRSDLTKAVIGDPLVNKRFLLQRLAWVTYKGPSASRSASGAGNEDIQALLDAGFTQPFLNLGDAATIKRYFGLEWNGTGWDYKAHNANSSIKKLSEIADSGRDDDPDFFELLKASVNVGAIAKASVSNAFTLDTMPQQVVDIDTSSNYAIIQLGANIIDQFDGDGFPTKITYASKDFYGVEDLPYFSAAHTGFLKLREADPASDPTIHNSNNSFSNIGAETLKDTGVCMWMVMPELWNPYDRNCNPGNPAPTNYRISADSGGVAAHSIYSINNVGSTNRADSRGNNGAASGPAFSTGYGGKGSVFNSPYIRPAFTASDTMMTFSVPAGNTALFREPTLLAKPGLPSGSNLKMAANLDLLDGSRYAVIENNASHSNAYTGTGFLSATPNPLRLTLGEPGYAATVNDDTFIGMIGGVFPVRFLYRASSTNSYLVYTTDIAQILSTDLQYVPLTFRVECQDASGIWLPYDVKSVPISHNWLRMPAGTGAPSNGATNPSAFMQRDGIMSYTFDPRTRRFGVVMGDHLGNSAKYSGTPGPEIYDTSAKGGWIDSANMVMTTLRPDANAGYGPPGRNGPTPKNWGATDPSSIGWHVGTSAFWAKLGLFTQNNPNATNDGLRFNGDTQGASTTDAMYYSDPDGVVRRAMGGYATNGSTVGLPMARATDYAAGNVPPVGGELRPTQSASRPWILNRPFRSVAELGYVFSGTPWKDLDFSTPESGFAPMLDVFTVTDTPNAQSLTAGQVSLNTRQKPVLTALLAGAYKDALDPANTRLTDTEAGRIADLLLARTSSLAADKGPIVNVSHIVGRWSSAVAIPGLSANLYADGSKSYVGFSDDLSAALTGSNAIISRFREAAIRPLVNLSQARVWNLMIDLVSQTGRFPVEATALNQFNVDAEHRYWMHVAIDRYTGAVLDQSLEEVFDAPTDLLLSKTSVAESQPAGALVGNLSAAGPLPGSVYSFALANGAGGDDNAAFTVNGNNLQTAATFQRVVKGSYNVRLRVTDQDGLSFEKPFTIAVVPNPYLQWKSAYFPGQENNPLISGDAADPDRDGMSNLLEYALGKLPTVADTAGLAVQIDGNVARLNYTRLSAATDITLHAYATSALDDPASWSASGITETMLSDDGTIQHWQASVPVSGSQRLFLRLQVTRP